MAYLILRLERAQARSQCVGDRGNRSIGGNPRCREASGRRGAHRQKEGMPETSSPMVMAWGKRSWTMAFMSIRYTTASASVDMPARNGPSACDGARALVLS
jgi:hypothetical protein